MPMGLPTGPAITFLFTDIEGSTRLERAVGALSERGMGCESDLARARALAFLARRGYPLETAYAAIRRRQAA